MSKNKILIVKIFFSLIFFYNCSNQKIIPSNIEKVVNKYYEGFLKNDSAMMVSLLAENYKSVGYPTKDDKRDGLQEIGFINMINDWHSDFLIEEKTISTYKANDNFEVYVRGVEKFKHNETGAIGDVRFLDIWTVSQSGKILSRERFQDMLDYWSDIDFGIAKEKEVTFSVDMSIEGVTGDVSLRTSTENGDYTPSDWYVMDDSDGDLVFTYTLSLETGIQYGYNFSNGGYESGDGLGECAGGIYGNDRIVTPGDNDITLDTVCWESCDACPEVIPGCMDATALNYDENATEDDASCFYEWPEIANLFFSEYAEGSSNNKYLEIYNASDGDVDLSGYSLSSCSNGCNDGVSWDYADNVTFDATVAAGDVYVVCHGSSDETILAECDQTFAYLSNGDDVFALTQIGSGAVLDIIGTIGDDPGSGWTVAGVSNATKDHTLVRDDSVVSGNAGDWATSAGDEDLDSEWIVLDQNDWTFLGYHEMDTGGGDDCALAGDLNADGIVNVLDVVTLVNGIVSGTDVECGDLNGDGIQNVLDIVLMVGIITSDRAMDAKSATLNTNNLSVSITADGYIGGVQMTLVHGDNFTIELTDECFASNYMNHGNYTTLVVVEPHSELIFTANNTFEIKELIVANSEDEINVSMINDFSLSAAYPNPFNPSTSFDISIPTSGYLSVKVYDLSGKLVDVIANGIYNQNNYTFTWDGSGMPSGMYVINAEYNNTSISHNISLIK